MSFDRKIDFVCPHTVVEEALFLSADRMTVRPLRPIAAINSVKVRVNGVSTVPSTGVALPAEALANRKGPFNVRKSVNDTLVVKVGNDAAQTVTIAPGEALTGGQVAERLNAGLRNVIVDITSRKRVRIRTHKTGKGATLMILATGSTLAPTIGFLTNRQWRGRKPFPGWSIIKDPNSLSSRPNRFVLFDEPLKGFRDYVELDYTTIRQECRRCGGLGIENDWRYNIRGDVIEVRDEALLIQEIQKMTYTVQGSNPFHTWYGTAILNMVGRKLSNRGLIQNFIVSDIREAFRRWQSIKRQQEEVVGQEVSDAEFPFQLLSVSLTPDTSNPTILFVTAVIQNRSQEPIQIARGVTLPLPENLLGGTVQEGIIRQSLNNFVLTG